MSSSALGDFVVPFLIPFPAEPFRIASQSKMVTPVPGKRRKSSESLPSMDKATGGGEAGSGAAGAASTSKRARSAESESLALPSSVSSALIIPNGVDTSTLPNGWEDIVRAELKACGVGAYEEYKRQLEAYDSSDDEAGEPPSLPPPARKRMGGERAAKHYRVTNPVARVLVKIVDVNLKEAGIDSWSINGPRPSIFTNDDDRLMEQLVEKEHAENGKPRVRRGFWEKINNEHFAGRGLTAKMLETRRGNLLSRRKKSLSSDDGKERRHNIFTDDDDRLVEELVAKEHAENGKPRVRPGFWERINNEHFAGRGLTAKKLENRRNNQNNREKKSLSSDDAKESSEPFTDAEDAIIRDAVARQIQESGTDKLPDGFWPSVIEAHSMRRDNLQLSKRWYHLKNKVSSDKVVKTSVPLRSSSERDTTGDGKDVDANLKEVGIASRSSIFTDDDDRLVEELIEKDLAESGKTIVRPGFWEKINNEHFVGRGFTAKVLKNRRKNQTFKKNKSSSPDAAKGSNEPFTDAEDAIIRDAATRQIQESGTDKLPDGFWPSVIEAHSMRRDRVQLSKRWNVLKNRADSDKIVKTSVPLRSSSERDTSGGEKEQKKTSAKGIFSNEDFQLMEQLVQEELQQCGDERVRYGFWGAVLEKYFADRSITIDQLRDYYKNKKKRRAAASEKPSSSNDAQATNNSHGVPFTSDEDEIVIKEAVNELREHGKLHYGFWPKVVENHSLNRTPTQLKSRYTHLKSRGKINLSETSSSSDVGGTVTSEQSEAIPTADEGPRDVQDAKSHSDTAPLTDDLIVFPAYQATTTKYPPQTLVTYRPSSGKANTCIVGRVLEVGIYPSQDNLYVYTIKSDDDASTYKRLPERLLEKR